MKVVYTPAHLLHDPHTEIEKGTVHSPFEHIGRGEVIREVLSADSRFDFQLPTQWGIEPINAVHNSGLERFLTTAWQEYQDAIGPCREVTPEVFYSQALRNKMSLGAEPASISGRLGWWCFETTTPLT